MVTSSESVYDYGLNLSEDRFQPEEYEFEVEVTAEQIYQAAKRQMESVFAKQAPFELAIVRPSFVVGTDDYKKRIEWHIDRIRSGLPIYFPNIDAQVDFIRSDQAGLALKVIGLSNHTGTFNCAAPGAISLRKFIDLCESAIEKKCVIASKYESDNHSPYGVELSKTVDTERLRSLGFDVPSLEQLIGKLVKALGLERSHRRTI